MPTIEKLSRLEYNAVGHRVFDVDADTRMGEVYIADTIPGAQWQKALAGPIWSKLAWSEHLVGSGTAGTPPPCGYTWQYACGTTYTNTPGTSDAYVLDHTLSKTGQTYLYYAGNVLRHSISNAVGNSRIEIRPGEVAKVRFELQGLYVADAEATGSAAQATIATPVVCKGLTCTVASDALVFREIDIDFGTEINSPDLDIGSSATQGVQAPLIIGQAPTIRILANVPAASTEDYDAGFVANTEYAFSIAIGSSAGNICTITGTFGMVAPPKFGWTNGLHTVELNGRFKFSANPLTITFT